jgi:hypothetical protein
VRRDWAIWALTRAFLLVIIAGWIPWPEQVNDLNIYAGWAADDLAAARFPDDFMWQYPPLAGLLLLAGWQLPDGHVGYALLFLIFDFAIMAMVSRNAQRWGEATGRLLWALVPLVTGPLLLARFDVVPTAFAVAAAVVAARPTLSGGLAAVGAWMKVWPALVVAGLRRRDLPAGLFGAAVVSIVVAITVMLTWTDPFGFLGGQRDRGLQIESVGAWPFLVWRALGGDVAVVYQYGAHEVIAPGVAAVGDVSLVLTLLLLALVGVQRLRGALEGFAATDVALATVLFSVVTSRVFSGQYFIWLLALGALCLNDPRSRMRRVTALLVVAGLATQAVYPWLYTALLQGSLLAVCVQSVRIASTVAATALAVAALVRGAWTPNG